MSGISSIIPEPIEIECRECSHQLRVYTHGQARYIGCQSCSSFFQHNNDLLKRIQKWDKTVKPHLNLGQKAYHRNGVYVLIGISAKAIPEYKVSWLEYLFFNPVHGYFSLSENNGHWMLMEVIRDYPREFPRLTTSIVYENKIYNLINRDRVITEYAIGEFPSNVLASVKADEFIRPPFMLAREIQEDCCEWYFGKYYTSAEVLALLKADVNLPNSTGVGAAQPHFQNLGSLGIKAVTALGIVLILTLAFLLNSQHTTLSLLTRTFSVPPKYTKITNTPSTLAERLADSLMKVMNPDVARSNSVGNSENPIFITEPFDVNGTLPVNLEVYFSSDLQNEWLFAQGYLVNELTGETTVFWNDIEYYSGYDAEGQWTEGSQEVSKTISSVKPGRYHLNLNAINETGKTKNLKVQIVAGKTIVSNLIVCLLLFLVLPAFLLWRRHNFERRRWMNSDYSPYSYDE